MSGCPHALELLQPLGTQHGLGPLHVVDMSLEEVGVPLVELAVLLLELILFFFKTGNCKKKKFKISFLPKKLRELICIKFSQTLCQGKSLFRHCDFLYMQTCKMNVYALCQALHFSPLAYMISPVAVTV